MMNSEWILKLIFAYISLFFIFYIYQQIHGFFVKLKKLIILSLVGTIGIFLLYNYFFKSVLYFGISMLILMTTIICFENDNNYREAIYFCVFLTTLIFNIYVLIGLLSNGQYIIIVELSFTKFLYSIYCTILILCSFFYVFNIKFALPTGKISLIILFSAILICVIELLLINQLKTKSSNNYLFSIIYIIIGLIFFSNNIIIQYLYNDFHQLTVMSQSNFLSKITDSYIQGIHNEQEKVFKIRHDIKNNLIILQHLINNNQIAEANQVIDEINSHLKYKKSDVYTGNIFIDAYLTNVIINSQIDIQIKCNDLKDLHYKPDIIAIIINLVDNAVENANHLVIIQIKRKKPNSILIKVSNDCEHDPSKYLKKSKKQGDHGYGLRIVKDIINQYQGTYITSYQNGMFTTYVMLNLEGNDEK